MDMRFDASLLPLIIVSPTFFSRSLRLLSGTFTPGCVSGAVPHQGRRAGTEGAADSASYIAKQFQKLGYEVQMQSSAVIVAMSLPALATLPER
jgi:hypothetical protein